MLNFYFNDFKGLYAKFLVTIHLKEGMSDTQWYALELCLGKNCGLITVI